MKTQVLVPNLPESVADATLISWHKKTGELVEKDENLIDLETDKIVLEVPAPESGLLAEIAQQDGATVTSGDLLAIIDSSKTQAEDGASPSTTEETLVKEEDTLVLSPAVRRIVLEKDLDPRSISGTGKNGRLTKQDVLDHIKSQSGEVEQSDSAKSSLSPPPKSAIPLATVKLETGDRTERRVTMTRLRTRIAERLIQAQQNAAMLTTFNEVNLNSVMDIRKRLKDSFLQKHGVKLGFMSFFVKAATEALKQFPVINASIDNQDIVYHDYYDIGIAVSSNRGLVVPILRDANRLDFAEIEKKISEFGAKAQQGGLTIDDLSGGTFTITNGGIFGSMMSTPILNPPQSAILGMHAIQNRPVVDGSEIVARPMMYLALSYDHRIIDGREAVQFLVSIKQSLEDPACLLLNL